MRDRNSQRAAMISVEGRNYPLDVFYSKHQVAFYATSAVEAALVMDKNGTRVEKLSFLLVRTMLKRLANCWKIKKSSCRRSWRTVFWWCKCNPARNLLNIFQRVSSRIRKVIFSTNFGEMSITIANIIRIVECGFMKTTRLSALKLYLWFRYRKFLLGNEMTSRSIDIY